MRDFDFGFASFTSIRQAAIALRPSASSSRRYLAILAATHFREDPKKLASNETNRRKLFFSFPNSSIVRESICTCRVACSTQAHARERECSSNRLETKEFRELATLPSFPQLDHSTTLTFKMTEAIPVDPVPGGGDGLDEGLYSRQL